MKIALCLHGYFNSQRDKNSLGDDGFHHIKKHILNNNNVDIYIHSWDIENEEKIISLYRYFIKNIKLQNQIDFKPLYYQNKLNLLPSRDGVTPFWNVFSQFYSIQKSFELMIESKINYDIIIKARFDLGRINRNTSGSGFSENPHAVQCINFNKNLNMNLLHMAYWQYLETEGPADMWFYSNKENMSYFAKIFDILKDEIKINSEYQKWAGLNDGGMLNTIKAWKWFLIKTDLWNKKNLLQTHWE